VSSVFEIIEQYAKSGNIIFGICDADDLVGFDESILNIPFFKGSFTGRISPGAFLHGAKSVIVLGVKIETEPIFEGLNRIMAGSLSGVDYHKRLLNIAKELTRKMLEEVNFNFKIQVDSGPLIERAFALKAGIGFIGKNNCVISSEFGSFFNIALIVTDINIDSTAATANLSCKGCELCLRHCPTKALSKNNGFDYNKCISYLTQKKGMLSEPEENSVGVSIYGCDLCQNVCPYNLPFILSSDRELQHRTLERIISMDKKQFFEKFEEASFFWRGYEVIRRNCLIALNNLQRDDR